MEDMVISFWIK